MLQSLPPITSIIENSQGLAVHFLDNGLVADIEAPPIRIGLNKATELGGFSGNFYLRNRETRDFTLLLGPESNSRFRVAANCYIAEGIWREIEYRCVLRLSRRTRGWGWSIALSNKGPAADLELFCTQDVGLTPATSGRCNEYYVSQYLERRILEDAKHGAVVCSRQNLGGPTGNPHLVLASRNPAIAASVDGMQFFGNAYRASGIPQGMLAATLGGEYSGESSIVALQETPFTLQAGGTHDSLFVAHFVPDHPQATSAEDLTRIVPLMREFAGNRIPESHGWRDPTPSRFRFSPLLRADDLTATELNQFFGSQRRHVESDNGHTLSFFCGHDSHVVLRRKELRVDRPHGHIMQARAAFVPDESVLSTTAYMCGVFNSHIAQGNSNFNRLLSVAGSQFNLPVYTGQRIFVMIYGRYHLLAVPSAFEIGLNRCRWIYKRGGHSFQIRTWTSKTAPQVNTDFKVLEGGGVDILISNQLDPDNGWTYSRSGSGNELTLCPVAGSAIAAKFPNAQFRVLLHGQNSNYSVSDDGALYMDAQSRGDAFFVVRAERTTEFCMSFLGELTAPTAACHFSDCDAQWKSDARDARKVWRDLSTNVALDDTHADTAALNEILPWYGVNALTHLLTPHGLEQVDGAAWGTRDTSQGPLELLLSARRFEDAKALLRIVFSNQNPDGSWPQWWMFDRYSSIRADDYHGDIFHWCIIALSNYIEASGDTNFLAEVLPYYHVDGIEAAEKTPLSEHVDRLIDMITSSFIAGTSLVPFGGGDWNDSMQPVSHDLAMRMISTWTVELNYQAFAAYQKVCERMGREQCAARLRRICDDIKADFNRHLVRDGTVSGHGLIEPDGEVSLLLHPCDDITDIQYRLLPMIRGIISGIFTSDQAQHHLALIEEHLKGPDGARLMNRAPKYHGGIQTLFQRAESSPYFGREIGLMYTHAHLRYAEALAVCGRADAFIKALRQATPVGYRDVVPCGDFRQANCYYSSSDAIFGSRFEAEEQYDSLRAGDITLKGGWRVYSSGPGIFIGLVVSRLIGLRESFGNTIIDPVVPHHLSGMTASLSVEGRDVSFIYDVGTRGCGPTEVSINGTRVEFSRESNPYRTGGALLSREAFLTLLDKPTNQVEIRLG